MAQVQLTTETKNFQHGQFTGQTSVVTRTTSTTRPTTVATGAGARLVIGCGTNYSKLRFLTTTTDVMQIVIYGWSFCPDLNAYVASLLFQTATVANNGTTITSGTFTYPKIGTVREVNSFIRSAGDAKIYNSGAAADPGAFLLLDTVGSEMIEIQVAVANSPIINVLSSSC